MRELTVPLVLTLGAGVVLAGCHLSWLGCRGAYCSTLRNTGACTDVFDGTACYDLWIRIATHLFEVVPSLLAVAGAVLAVASLRRQALVEWSLKAWRSGAALQWGVLPVGLLFAFIDILWHGHGAASPRALAGSAAIAALAMTVPGRLGLWRWGALAAVSFVLVSAIAWIYAAVGWALLR